MVRAVPEGGGSVCCQVGFGEELGVGDGVPLTADGAAYVHRRAIARHWDMVARTLLWPHTENGHTSAGRYHLGL